MVLSEISMSRGFRQWMEGRFITVTFCVTEDCNLACKYCYMVGKNSSRKMSYETAKRIVDFVLGDDFICHADAVAWDFIGGEPLLEMDLIDKISDYILVKMYMLKHKWFGRYRFTFSTNGVLYGNQKVQDYIKKHEGHVSFSLSVDGTKQKHDLSRVKKDGTGSYDDVIKNVPLWLERFPSASTKSTFASDDLPYLRDSVIHLWDIGIHNVMANVVYEDVWKDGDDEIFESQLRGLADYIIDNELWDKYTVAFFENQVGLPVSAEDLEKSRCGAGYKSLAFDSNGNIFPCIRFLELCFSGKQKIIIGNIDDGLNMDYIRAFAQVKWKTQSPEKCMSCDVGRNCGWCTGYNFDVSANDTINERTTYICKMHKANARANRYFWTRYSEQTGRVSPRTVTKANLQGIDCLKYMYFITSDDITPHCSYENNSQSTQKMPDSIIQAGLRYCRDNEIVPVFLGSCDHGLNKETHMYYEISNCHDQNAGEGFIGIYDHTALMSGPAASQRKDAILLVNGKTVHALFSMISDMYAKHSRINLFIEDMHKWTRETIDEYKKQIDLISDYIYESYKNANEKNLNILTDLMFLKKSRDCGAGLTSITLAPNGQLYICPAFYFNNEKQNAGSLSEGQNVDARKLYKRQSSYVCMDCNIHNCNRCLYINKKMSRELNTPPQNQCEINYINAKASNALRDRLLSIGLLDGKDINKSNIGDYLDVIDIARAE